jgi:uncharacterized protein (TIGR02646 family)
MRKIEKRTEPAELRQWRAAHQADPAGAGVNFGYSLLGQSPGVVERLMESLLAEQGRLCAYTGRRIDAESAHFEHLVAQDHCVSGQDVSYNNLLACWPQPNGPHGEYGAHTKGNWPAPNESHLFVSPLGAGCEARFTFNFRGEIGAANPADEAATMTIRKLRLCHKTLTALRGSAIQGVLGRKRNLRLKDARTRLRQIREDEAAVNGGANIQLDPSCFAVKQALERHIRALERIRNFAV